MQSTVRRATVFSGVGVHGGRPATAIVKPAAAGEGVVFVRTDLNDGENEIAARYDNVVDTRLCTVIANRHGASVSTIEHLMAALAGLGIDNARIEIDGPETPIMDGSSAPFVQALRAAGVATLNAPRPAIEVLRTVTVRDGDKSASLSRAPFFKMSFEIDFEEEAIGRQARSLQLVNGAFVDELCRARTFGRLHEVQQLREAGLARGGSLDNAIVVDGARVLNPDGLRFEDEFVRHKMLDAVGDLALAGAPIIGAYRGYCAGHGMTNKLLHALFADPTAWRLVEDDLTVIGAVAHRLGSGVAA